MFLTGMIWGRIPPKVIFWQLLVLLCTQEWFFCPPKIGGSYICGRTGRSRVRQQTDQLLHLPIRSKARWNLTKIFENPDWGEISIDGDEIKNNRSINIKTSKDFQTVCIKLKIKWVKDAKREAMVQWMIALHKNKGKYGNHPDNLCFFLL